MVAANLRSGGERAKKYHQGGNMELLDLIPGGHDRFCVRGVEKFDPTAATSSSPTPKLDWIRQGITGRLPEKSRNDSGCRSTSPKPLNKLKKAALSLSQERPNPGA